MKNDGFSYIVSAELLFTEEEVDLMIKLALDHYDHTCRLAAMPRDPVVLRSTNGMLNILKSQLQDARLQEWEPTPRSCSSSDLNLLMKILEGRAFIREEADDAGEFDKAETLTKTIRNIFKALSARMQELNSE